MTDFWIEKTWGESIDSALIFDAYRGIEEIMSLDDEDSSLWIGHVDEEYVLKIHKDLQLSFIYGKKQDKQLKITAKDRDKVQLLIKKYFDKDFNSIKKLF